MARLFAYGTLREAAVLARVVEHGAKPLGETVLEGFAVFSTDQGYPVLFPVAGGTVRGRLWELAAADLPALDRYEGAREAVPLYLRRRVPVRGGPAWVYLGNPLRWERGGAGYVLRGEAPARRVPPPQERFAGSLLAAAAGDALGMPVEGLTAEEIRARWGSVRHYLSGGDLGPGQYTDDTQQTLALARSLLAAGGFAPEAWAGELVEWYRGGPRRAGRASLQAARNLARGAYPSGVSSVGCGAAMRVAPLGLLYARDGARLLASAAQSARLTHEHPAAVAGAVAMAWAVGEAATTATVEAASFLEGAAEVARGWDRELAGRIRRVEEFWGLEPAAALGRIGTSGDVRETLPAALYCFLLSPGDLAGVLTRAVEAGGDTDSVASMAGALAGAYGGACSLPRAWYDGLEDREEIEEVARALWELARRS
ncbi:MAG: ADP-ribosylglycohydrolase family protein [Thermaerobacter sp.]|jgi:ADP-ribosylglycohydrolase/gamma-glutamylcyclotransferase (GGCT)/AIG2-like uncharacterized protein YtfP|nr:ADP-ribosylglycohydrolase family protein [Thermaerobacter sp.]